MLEYGAKDESVTVEYEGGRDMTAKQRQVFHGRELTISFAVSQKHILYRSQRYLR